MTRINKKCCFGPSKIKFLFPVVILLLFFIFIFHVDKQPHMFQNYQVPFFKNGPSHSQRTAKVSTTTSHPRTETRIFCESFTKSEEEIPTVLKPTHLGCFEMQKQIKAELSVTYAFMTTDWCTSFCQSNNKTYAAMKGVQCKCSTDIYLVVSIEKPTNTCTSKCSGDRSETCGGEKSADVYFLRGTCKKAPFDKEFAESRYKGCFAYPAEKQPMLFYGTTSEISDCLLLCEQERHPLAVMDKKSGCFCGRITKSFNLTHKIDEKDCGQVLNAVQVYRTLADDERCSKVRLLPPGKRNRTLLASFPGSGNTWTRFLLEKATGYYTGSVYGDKWLIKTGYLGERHKLDNSRADMIKDHLFGKNQPSLKKLEAAILVIRNPYHAFIAYANFKNGGHVGSPSEDVLNATLTFKKVTGWLGHWKSMLSQILNAKMTLKVIYFEDMVADPISSVRKMVEFLPNPLLHPNDLAERLACLSQDTTGLAKRKSKPLSFNPFSVESRKAINRTILEMREALKKAGVKEELPPYENDPQSAL